MSELVLSEENLRKMPFSMEAEQSVLGTIILDPEKLNDIASILRADDFYLEQHVRIYEPCGASLRALTHILTK